MLQLHISICVATGYGYMSKYKRLIVLYLSSPHRVMTSARYFLALDIMLVEHNVALMLLLMSLLLLLLLLVMIVAALCCRSISESHPCPFNWLKEASPVLCLMALNLSLGTTISMW